ncbi:hypothetical protein BST44_01375 [Mycobacterium scrofulaceum]|uniref:Uncharacterized protein n=1 Tax=Mycobacterium scrofulaceum TaxID=1783 RepID=A0A1X0KNJ9_MYCSC|nr:hypothetical protein BST44_01375 [Mycobacterium scrofulaceum]
MRDRGDMTSGSPSARTSIRRRLHRGPGPGGTATPVLRQHHKPRRQLRGDAAERQIPGGPRVGFAPLYGAPCTAAATILTT